jgi:hypothetical protein
MMKPKGLLAGGGGGKGKGGSVGPRMATRERVRRLLRSEAFVTAVLLLAAGVLFMLPNMLVRMAPPAEVDERPPAAAAPPRAPAVNANVKKPSAGAGARGGGGGGSGGGKGSGASGPKPPGAAGGAAVFQRMQQNTSKVVKLDAPRTLTAATELGLLPRMDVDPKQMPRPLTAEDTFVTLANAAKMGAMGALPKRGSIPLNFAAVTKRFKREDDGSGRRGDGSCAVVGNSGVILSTAAAAAIESHDVVIRFNQAPTMVGRCRLTL